MTNQPTRREFLRSSATLLGTLFCAAGAPVLSSIKGLDGVKGSLQRFPQGVASADPTPESIVLWTRVEPVAEEGNIELLLQVSTARDFKRVLLEQSVTATAASDHTVRVVVTSLHPATTLYFRFIDPARRSSSVGRTRTAPAHSAAVPIRFAFASCQNYQTGYYHAYRHLLEREKLSPEREGLDFVLFLGDFIYEMIFPEKMGVAGRPLQFPDKPWDDKNQDFGQRIAIQYAQTVDEYRYLYRAYLQDPWLRAARERWPFVCIFDDHEMADDYWQSMSVYTTPSVPSQQRKVAANQAWYEYVPAMLSDLPRDSPARDFQFAAVENVPFSGESDGMQPGDEPNNRKAIETINISRHLSWGRYLDLVLTDSRSHRSAHPVPGEIGTQLSFHPRALLPRSLVEELDAGRTANAGQPREIVEVSGLKFPNPRLTAPPGTMYGAAQKTWVKQRLTQSKAVWRLCANSIPQLPLSFDFRFDGKVPADDEVVITDSWEGYPAERREMLEFIRDQPIPNYVSLTGDHHMHFAGLLSPNRDDGGAGAVGVEFCCAGVSSSSFGGVLRDFATARMAGTPAAAVVTGPTVAPGAAPLPWLNVTTMYGWRESARLSGQFRAGASPDPRARRLRHLAFMDADSYGIGVVTVTHETLHVDLLTFDARQAGTNYSKSEQPVYRASFVVNSVLTNKPLLEGPSFSGPPPFPFT